MGRIYLPTSRNYQSEGTPVKICFEGKVTRGVLIDSNDNKHIVCVKTPDGKTQWSHESHVTLDHPEPQLPVRWWRG
jgi:hypothetical protein